jgi:DNA-binding LacI/PurR family transcriptional regulator
MGGERLGEVAMRRLVQRIQDPATPDGHDDLAPRLQARATTRRRDGP